MMTKPRYWQVAFPLAITSLCVAPQSYFLKHWFSCFEGALSKLKVSGLALYRYAHGFTVVIRKSHIGYRL